MSGPPECRDARPHYDALLASTSRLTRDAPLAGTAVRCMWGGVGTGKSLALEVHYFGGGGKRLG